MPPDGAERPDRWDNDEDGNLDDIVVHNVKTFRMERMNVNGWWIGLYVGDKLIHIDITIDESGMIATRRED